jgi:hypothetical protein
MPLVQLTPPPGVITEITDYQAGMRYTSADKVRFRFGQPEKIGGWAKRDAFNTSTFSGINRNIKPHRDTDGVKYIFYGTSTHVYIEYSNVLYDVTPFRTDTQALTNPFTTGTAGTSTVTVAHTNHGVAFTSPASRVVIQSIASGTVDGITITAGEYFATYVNANSYTITAVPGGTGSITGTAAVGGQTGGGSVNVRYLVNNGPDDGLTGYGFGAGLWGSASWGTARSTSGIVLSPRVWSMDAWGEDIVASVGGGEDTIYYFDVSAFKASVSTFRGTTLAYYITNTLSGDASQVPTKVGQILVSTPDRHLVVFGCNPQGSSTYDRTTIRFASQESLSVWDAQITNTAGSQKLGTGTNIEAAKKGRGQIYIWTDVDLYGMQFVGPPFTFSFSLLGEASGTISKNSPAMIEGGAFWMGTNNFYAYDGAVQTLKCPVLNYVFDDLNPVQREKIFSAEILEFNEIWWFYPSSTSTEVDRYVIYNYIDNTWSIGNLDRTAWHDSGIFTFPIASNSAGKAFNQENGVNDESSALASSLETGYFSGDANGDNIIFMKRIIPDTSFSAGTTINFEIKSKRYPNDTEITKGPFAVTSSTNKLNLRSRGRSFQCKWSSSAVDTSWRLGTWRAEGQADGTR